MIYLDMDGPLVNFNQSFLDLLVTNVKHDDLNQWDIWKCLGMTNQEMWDKINPHGCAWWRNLKPYPWAMDLYRDLLKLDDVTILTNPSWSPHACKGKLEWLQDRFGLEFEDWIFTSKKEHLSRPGSVLIDDSPANCSKFVSVEDGGGSAVLFPLPWNVKDWECRPARVEDVVPMVKRLLT